MKNGMVYVGVLCLMALCLSGCPKTAVEGNWVWTEAATPADPDSEDSYMSDEVNENFQNAGRLRKTLTLGAETDGIRKFTFVEEAYVPDRSASAGKDKGAGVVWAWKETYKAEGSYETAAFDVDSCYYQIPNIDTEFNAEVTSWTQLFAESTGTSDESGRSYIKYTSLSDTSDSGNPLVLSALMGVNPFDELLVIWSREGMSAKDFELPDYNTDLFAEEVYTRK